ncbi:MAG: response regulator transcription factor [Burkholderiales bacterium]
MTQDRDLPPSPRSILVVEDNPQFVREIQRAIAATGDPGATTTTCATGSDALAFVGRADCAIDLALIDLGLPDMSGIEVIRAIHRRFPDVPIMVISVASSEESVLDAIRAGARGYLLKGDPGAEMATAIDEVLRGNYPISPSLARALFRLAGAPAAAPDAPAFELTQRELETLQLIARGHSYKEVAREMNVALSTVQSNIRNLYRKLEVHSHGQAVTKARDAGLL